MAKKWVQIGAQVQRLNSIGRAGNPLAAARAATEVAATPYIDKAAQRFVEKRSLQKPEQKDSPKMTGVGFFVIICVALLKDFLDILLNFSVLLILLVIPVSIFISFIIFIYFYMEGVKMDSRKIATMVVGFFLDALPIFSIFPTFTLTVFFIRWLENNAFEKLAKKIPFGSILLRNVQKRIPLPQAVNDNTPQEQQKTAA